MGRNSSVFRLPAEIRSDLNSRLLAANFTGYDELAKWLDDAGHDVSRSTIHRYAKELESLLKMKADPSSGNSDLRIRCAECVSRFSTDGDLVELASDLYFWVTTGTRT